MSVRNAAEPMWERACSHKGIYVNPEKKQTRHMAGFVVSAFCVYFAAEPATCSACCALRLFLMP